MSLVLHDKCHYYGHHNPSHINEWYNNKPFEIIKILYDPLLLLLAASSLTSVAYIASVC